MFRVLCEKHSAGRQAYSDLVWVFLVEDINYSIFHNILQENWCLPDSCRDRL